ncbi:MAG: glutamate-5-semialdehyde dehydrogenase [Lachnospiraceae bacterium]|nr:glutamate-5-semialdehyde dehydrogenase [Ruminococcus sp.]MCM1275740.1 glutamate-5-semialdehyde dehydrogenase [Lachnospiraceae bacterium]
MEYIEMLGIAAKKAAPTLADCGTGAKNRALLEIAKRLRGSSAEIVNVNKVDVENARKNGVREIMLDRLTLNEKRVESMAEGVEQVAALPDPVGEVMGGKELPNGLCVTQKRVPMGVIGIIFESRPNVTVDAAALCFKAGNAVILRGGSDAINTNKFLVGLMRGALAECGLPEDCVQLVEDTSHESATALMRLNKYVDLLIPRGGGRLIHTVVENATVPVIQTGEGNCHVFVDESADLDMAVDIVDNAKTQRPSVCNAIESILVHENVAGEFFKRLDERWNGKVAVIGDERTAECIKVEKIADEDDYGTEFLDYRLSSRVVSSVDEAIEHINRFGTGHSECIVTKSLENARKFQRRVDAAAVYVNASTRFTDGFEFGLGAEIGISTQKLHARGPMGLAALTSYKYLIDGSGQIRS